MSCSASAYAHVLFNAVAILDFRVILLGPTLSSCNPQASTSEVDKTISGSKRPTVCC